MARQIHFNQLPAELRDRLALSFDGEGDITPLLSDKFVVSAGTILYGALSLFCALATFVAVSHQYGDLGASGHAPWWIILYALPLFATLYCILKFITLKRLGRRLPFTPGIYVFPLELVDARDSVLHIIPTADITRVEINHEQAEEVYANTELIFHSAEGVALKMRVVGEEIADEFGRRFDLVRAQAQDALATHDLIALSSLDPFLSIRLEPDGWARYSAEAVAVSDGLMAKDLSAPLRYFWIVAMVLSIGLSPLIWLVRQRSHDTARFEAAKVMPLTGEPNRAQAIELYLDDGLFHREEAVEEALPQARFDVAMAHSQQALRELLIRHPNFKLKDQVEAELYKPFRAALAQYKAQTNPAHPDGLVFMTKLMTYMERQKERSLKVVLMPAPVDQLEAPLAVAFTPERTERLGRAVMTQLRSAFSMIAHTNVLPVELGYDQPVVEADAQGEQRFKALRFPVPTLLIDYTARAAAVEGHSERTNTEGSLSFDLQVWMYIPGDAAPLSATFKIEPTAQELNIPDDFIQSEPHAALYDRAVSSAFYRFSQALVAYFFAPQSEVGKRFARVALAP